MWQCLVLQFQPRNRDIFCKTHLQLPIKKEVLQFNKSINNQTLVGQGFEIIWHVDPHRDQNCGACLMSNGICGYNKLTTFLCYCPDGTSHPEQCHGRYSICFYKIDYNTQGFNSFTLFKFIFILLHILILFYSV